MSKTEEKAKEKIILSALTLMMERGISKTSLNEVAYHAGVSRVTVYRHFNDKKALVRAAFLSVEKIFLDGLKEFQQNPPLTLEIGMDIIGNNLRALPPGDVVKRADELKRIYPDVYAEIQALRESTLNMLFNQISEIGQRQNLLREGLNRDVVKAVFWELTINFFDNPRFKSFGLNDADLYYQMSRILLYGILKGEPEIP
jgi:AcrR family transcriptional regulator